MFKSIKLCLKQGLSAVALQLKIKNDCVLHGNTVKQSYFYFKKKINFSVRVYIVSLKCEFKQLVFVMICTSLIFRL